VIGTLNQSLQISGYFDLLEREMYPGDFAKEGMRPNLTGWFNASAQGLVKSSFEISGKQIKLTLKLFDIDQKRLITLSEGVDQQVILPSNPKVIRAHIHRFVNQVIKFYTGSVGFLGSRIAAVRKGSKGKTIVYVSADGRSVQSVIRGGRINMLPHLSLGNLYFTSFRNGGAHLFTYQQGKVKGISARKGINMGGALSPNGKLLAAVLSYQGSSDIYLLNPKSGEILRRLTRHKSIDVSPTWSPDGRRIAFVSDREGSSQIWMMNANGSGKRRITYKGEYNQSPSWSPKGDLIAYTGRDEKFAFDIFTIDPDSPQKLNRLTQNQGKNEEPSFSPDGRHIAFSSSRTGRSELYIMTLDGFTQRQLTRGGGYLSPSWERSR
jgi:TolB protein